MVMASFGRGDLWQAAQDKTEWLPVKGTLLNRLWSIFVSLNRTSAE
jgi:hypothetical protein